MLTTNDLNRIRELENENPEFAYYFGKLKEENQFSLSKISHEIRNPVTVLNSFLQLFETKHPIVTQDSYWIKIIENISHLRALLEELSSYNNSETVHKQSVNPCTLLLEVLEASRPLLEARSITLSFHQENVIPNLMLDPVKIQQVFYNLLRNAAEAFNLNTGGNITVTVQSEYTQVLITVADTGCGIPEEHINTLFEPFVTHKKEGTGLGLAICKRILEAHNGNIRVSSVVGCGTIFTICLPVSAPERESLQRL